MSNLSNSHSNSKYNSSSGTASRKPGPVVRHVTVSAQQAGQRLDNFLLRELKGVPRSRVYRLVRKGEVRVNLGRTNVRYRLRSGDTVRIPPVRTSAAVKATSSAHIDPGKVLYEDADLLVVDKPPGLPVHGGTGVDAGVIEALRARHPDLPFLELVHRLDRDTSGCLMLAKSRKALTGLHASLRGEEGRPVAKHYTALVRGRVGRDRITVDTRLSKNRVRGGERMVVVDGDGDRAESVFRAEQAGDDVSLVDIELVTGRTHQARVHAAHIGHPIAGDRKYGDREFNRMMRDAGVRRLALHARSLELDHPVTGERIRIEAPLPAFFQDALRHLES